MLLSLRKNESIIFLYKYNVNYEIRMKNVGFLIFMLRVFQIINKFSINLSIKITNNIKEIKIK